MKIPSFTYLRKYLLEYFTKNAYIVAFLYACFLFLLTVLKLNLNPTSLLYEISLINRDRQLGFWNINLMPFSTITFYFKGYLKNRFTFEYIFVNIIGNVLIYIPFGFFVSLTHIKGIMKILFVCFIFILLIESIQFFTMLGYFDVDDIFLNLVGCIAGYYVFKIFIYISKI